MKNCSILKNLTIVPGNLNDYRQLARYHYRDESLKVFAKIFAIRLAKVLGLGSAKTIGVIVYTMPSPVLELRNIATGNLFTGLGKNIQLKLINNNIRCISRVIIEPRFRGLGLASKLVRETLDKMNIAVVEAMAVMGLVNPFFERAGMMSYRTGPLHRCKQLAEALNLIGVEEDELIDPEKVHYKLQNLSAEKGGFMESQIKSFLRGYGKRSRMPPGPERTKYILSKLTERPIYYIWFNPQLSIVTS